ncbi:MAG: FHA domain-containing protein [Bacteroidetes bacterium]|nr:FHA domain-containing protein [Bacteroidota bacterium]
MVRNRTSEYLRKRISRGVPTFTAGFLRLVISFILVFSGTIKAQDLQIVEVDSSQYPNIRLSVVFKGNTRFEEDKFSIRQDNKKIIYNIRESAAGNAENQGRAVFFLVEASGNTAGKGVVDLREGLAASLDNLNPEDMLNVGWFGSFEADSTGLNYLSGKFTAEHALIRKSLYKIYAKEDSLGRADLYNSILESLNYISRQENLPERKLFIVLSSSVNNSNMPTTSAECIHLAKDLNIPLFSATYISNDSAVVSSAMTRLSARTGGKNTQVRNQINIINAISDFFTAPLPVAIRESKYDISFTVSPELNPSKAKLDISYNGNRQILIVQDPAAGQLIPEDFKPYLWYSIGILGVLVVVMIVYNAFSKKRSNNKDEKEEEQESSAAGENRETETPVETKPATVAEPKPLATSSKHPVLLLNRDGRTETFHLRGDVITLGRHETNDITLPEVTVTGKHAVIKINGNGITIEDLGSTNGTFVNGERIRSRRLNPGDIVSLGKVQLTLKE